MNAAVSSPAVKVVRSVQEQVSPEEWQSRVNLAACYRLTARSLRLSSSQRRSTIKWNSSINCIRLDFR